MGHHHLEHKHIHTVSPGSIPSIHVSEIDEPEKTGVRSHVKEFWRSCPSLPIQFQYAFNEWCRPGAISLFFVGQIATCSIAGNHTRLIMMGPRREARPSCTPPATQHC